MNIQIKAKNKWLEILRIFKKKELILQYPEKIYISMLDSQNSLEIGNLEYFRNAGKTKLIEYQRVQLVEVEYPSQITIPADQIVKV